MTAFSIYNWSLGYGIITGVVLLAVIIYTIFMLRKQVSRKKKQKKGTARKDPKDQKNQD